MRDVAQIAETIPDELRRHTGRGAEVVRVRRVEREIRVRVTTTTPAIGKHSANLPECPAGDGRSAGYIGRVRLEEVDLVEGVGVSSATKQCQEHQ